MVFLPSTSHFPSNDLTLLTDFPDVSNFPIDPRSDTKLFWVKVNPTKGKWRAEKIGLDGVGGKISVLIPISSTSKWLVSVGLDTSGI